MTTWTTAAAVTAMLAATPAQAGTLLQELAESGRYEHFLAGLRAAHLTSLLTGPGEVTVFAPTDAAYERVVSPARQAAFDDDPALVRQVVETHVVPGAAHSADALPRQLKTASGATLAITWTGATVTLQVEGGEGAPAVIGGTQIRAANGIVHPLDGLLMPQQVGATAGVADGDRPMPADGSFLDEAVGGADRSAVAAADVEPTAPKTAQKTDTQAAEAAPSAGETQAPVVIEEMNVTVETAPPVTPRTVAPSKMMGAEPPQQPETRKPKAGQAESRPPSGNQQAAASAGGEDAVEEDFLGSTVVGWSLYDSKGQEIGEVEHLILSKNTGDVAGVLVEIGGILGTGIGSHLVRVGADELRIDLADEALVTDVPADDITGRDAYQGPELDP